MNGERVTGTNLSALPPELLRLTLYPLGAEEVKRLYMSGNKPLMAKLCSPSGVVKWKERVSGVRRFIWPFIISQFQGLKHISIKGSATIGLFQAKQIHILTLPQTVVEMELSFYGSFSSFQHLMKDENDRFPNLRILSISGEPDTAYMDGRAKWPVNLESLTVIQCASMLKLYVDDLPPGLTHFDGKYLSIEGEGSFPPNLTDLTLKLASIPTNFLNMLPSKLLNLSVKHPINDLIRRSWNWDLLPKSLLKLNCPVLPQNVDEIDKLPKTLQEISSMDEPRIQYDDTTMTKFPPRIRDLGPYLRAPICDMAQFSVKNLPATLTTLGKSVVRTQHIVDLPGNLTELTVSLRSYNYIRPQIQHMAKHERKAMHCAILELPLQRLTLGYDFELFECAPSISSPFLNEFTGKGDGSSSTSLFSSLLSPFPSTLTELDLIREIPTIPLLKFLPRTLTSLKSYYAYEGTDDFFSLLPPSLTSFDSGYARWGPPLDMDWTYPDGMPHPEVIMKLGSEATMKQLACSSATKSNTRPSFSPIARDSKLLEREQAHAKAYFPPTLVHLTLASVSLVNPDWLNFLPSGVESIKMILRECSNLEWKDVSLPSTCKTLELRLTSQPSACFISNILKSLPPYLTSLSIELTSNEPLECTNVSDSLLAFLPRSVKSLRLPHVPITSHAALYIPASLTALKIGQKVPNWFFSYKTGKMTRTNETGRISKSNFQDSNSSDSKNAIKRGNQKNQRKKR